MGTIFIKPPKNDTYIVKKRYYPETAKHYCKKDKLLIGRVRERVFRTLLQFDLSALPSDLAVVSAYVKLYVYNNEFITTPKTLDIYPILSKYHPKYLSWKHQPLVEDIPAASMNLKDEINIFVPFNITPLVQDWLSGRVINLGILVKQRQECEDNLIRFRSGDYAETNKWPFLEINYLEPAGKRERGIQIIDLVENVLGSGEWNQTASTNILPFNYSYVIVNTGNYPALAYLEQSADGEHWERETLVHRVGCGETATFIPNYIMKYARLGYKSETTYHTTLSIYVQGRANN